eukprot:765912-Hanusia_phi.AAC.3
MIGRTDPGGTIRTRSVKQSVSDPTPRSKPFKGLQYPTIPATPVASSGFFPVNAPPASSCCPPSLPTYFSQTPNISKVLRATSTHP